SRSRTSTTAASCRLWPIGSSRDPTSIDAYRYRDKIEAHVNAFVELDKVSLRYGEQQGTLAIEHVDLGIEAGQFAAVVGPSGCGKSSLMKLVTGLLPPTSGAVRVAGKPVNGPLKIVGMAFQNPTLLPWRNTLSNTMLPLEIVQPHRGRLRQHREEYVTLAKKLLAAVGLNGFEEKQPWMLSGGMQQRA